MYVSLAEGGKHEYVLRTLVCIVIIFLNSVSSTILVLFDLCGVQAVQLPLRTQSARDDAPSPPIVFFSESDVISVTLPLSFKAYMYVSQRQSCVSFIHIIL